MATVISSDAKRTLIFLTQRAELNLPPIQAEARLKQDIKAIKTISITMATYSICYVPAIAYGVAGLQKLTLADSWFAFIAACSIYISSTVNPMVYYLRTRRCRSALKQFLKDPFGSSDFKEKPNANDHGNSATGHDEAIKRKKSSKRFEGGDACKVKRSGNQTSKKYLGKRRNALVMTSIKDIAYTYSHHGLGDCSSHEKGKVEQGDEACASNPEEQNSCEGKGEETKKANDKVTKKCGLQKEFEKLQTYSLKKKVHPQRSWDPNREKPAVYVNKNEGKIDSQETSGKRRISTTAGQRFEKGLTTRRINGQEHEQKQGEDPERTDAEAEAGAGPGPGTEAEAEVGMEAGAGAGMEAGEGAGAEAEAEAEAEVGMEAREGAGAAAGEGAGAGAGGTARAGAAGAAAAAGGAAAAGAGAGGAAEAEEVVGMKRGEGPGAEVGIEAGAGAKGEARIEAEAEARAGTEAGLEADLEAGIEAGIEAEAGAKGEAGIEAEAEAQAGTEAGLEARMEAAAEARARAKAGTEAEAGEETGTEAGVKERKAEPEVEMEAEAEAEGYAEAKAGVRGKAKAGAIAGAAGAGAGAGTITLIHLELLQV